MLELLRIDGLVCRHDQRDWRAGATAIPGLFEGEQGIWCICPLCTSKTPPIPSRDANENLPAAPGPAWWRLMWGVASGTLGPEGVYECLARSTELAT
jgi:hypothetical protein